MLRPDFRFSRESAFTLAELLVVIAIIGVLAKLAFSNYIEFRYRARAARTAVEMKSFAEAFLAFSMVTGEYPPDTHNELPAGMEAFIAPIAFDKETPLGGRYNWEGPDHYPYAGLAIDQPTVSNSVLQVLDSLLDNGDLSSGKFRLGINGRPTYMIDEMS